MQFSELVKCPRRLTIIPSNVCLICSKITNVREIWYCNDRLFGNILCYDCCSFEDGVKMLKYWMNSERNVEMKVGDISLVEYMKNLELKYKVKRSSGNIDEGWEVKWFNPTCDFLQMDNGNAKLMMVKYDEGIEKLCDLVELIELNIEKVGVLFDRKIILENWLVIGDSEERIFFEDVKNWEKSFTIFMKNINDNWELIWNYEEKIFE